MPVPSNVTRDGSFCDLKRKNTEEDMVQVHRMDCDELCFAATMLRESIPVIVVMLNLVGKQRMD